MLKRLLRREEQPQASGYEAQRNMAQSTEIAVRRGLAEDRSTKPEILYFLAEDQDASVRQAVAGNAAAPGQADILLAKDGSDEVREALALKIGRLMPDLRDSERARVREMAIQTLETLAIDQLPRVRAVLAEHLKDSADVPKEIVLQLARDAIEIVCAPILEYSPLLNDTDLKEIIAAGAASGALSAIARRDGLSGDVSDAVAATLDVPAVADLLANESAQIREDTLDRITENAEAVEAWHEPIVMRPELSRRAMLRISGFVASSLVAILADRNDLDEETALTLSKAMRERLQAEKPEPDREDEERVRDMVAAGQVDDDTLQDAAFEGRRGFVVNVLATELKCSSDAIEKLFALKEPKIATALVWKAGYSMRSAYAVQSGVVGVPPAMLLNARNGTDFPISEAEMNRMLQNLS